MKKFYTLLITTKRDLDTKKTIYQSVKSRLDLMSKF